MMAKIGPNGQAVRDVKKTESPDPQEQPIRSRGRLDRAEPIDIMAAFTEEPPELDFVLPGFLAGTVGALVAPGATGKSYWALEMAMTIATGYQINPLGIDQRIHRGGDVLYVAGEDPEVVIRRRLNSIGQHIDPLSRQDVADALQIRCTTGLGFDVMTDGQELIDIVMPPELQEEVGDSDYRLIILDTLSRIHTLDENSNGDMSKLLGRLEGIARSTGASVLVLHHTSKSAARDGQLDAQQAARGASALIDNARFCGYVARMTKEEAKERAVTEADRPFYMRYGVSKGNYSEPIGDSWLKRAEGGVLLPADDLLTPETPPRNDDHKPKNQGMRRAKM